MPRAVATSAWADAEASIGLVVHPACPACGASSALRPRSPQGDDCPECGVFVAPRQSVEVEGRFTGFAGRLLSIGRTLARLAMRI